MKKKFRMTIVRVAASLSFAVSIDSDPQVVSAQQSRVGASSRVHRSVQPAVSNSPAFSQPNLSGQRQNISNSFQGGYSQGGASTGFRSSLQPSLAPNSIGGPMTSPSFNQFVPGVNAVSPNGGMMGNQGFGHMHHHINGQVGNNFGQGSQGQFQSGTMIRPSANGTQPVPGNTVNFGGYNNDVGGIGNQPTHFRHAGHNHGHWNGNIGNNRNFGYNGIVSPIQGYRIGNFSSQQFNNGYNNGGFGGVGIGGLGYGGLGHSGFGGMAYTGSGLGNGFGNMRYAGQGIGYGGNGFVGVGNGPLVFNSGYLGYTNPYINNAGFNSIGTIGNGFNYTQPIPVSYRKTRVSIAPSTTVATKTTSGTSTISVQSMLDGAVAAFKLNQFDMALKVINQGIYEYPNEPVLHEFRALVLFAKGDYPSAAATMHSVLAVSRGWDWATMIGVYSDVEVYTTQLRALERNVKQNPDDSANRFLLAYHYLTGGFAEPAAKMLRKVVLLVPSDRVAAELLKRIEVAENVELPELATQPTPQPSLLPPPADPSPIAVPIDPAKLVGAWTANRADGSAFSLTLTKEKTFAWSFTPKQQSPQSFDGTYSVQGDVVTLERNGGGSLVAKIRQSDESHFHFKLFGTPDDDPGLDFDR